MSDDRQQMSFDELSAPAGVSVAKLSLHFRNKYKLDETQANGLVVSSAKSLKEFISQSNILMEEHGKELVREHIRGVVHSGVGIFRTMGENDWAGYLQTASHTPAETLYNNFQTLIKEVQKSFSDIIETI